MWSFPPGTRHVWLVLLVAPNPWGLRAAHELRGSEPSCCLARLSVPAPVGMLIQAVLLSWFPPLEGKAFCEKMTCVFCLPFSPSVRQEAGNLCRVGLCRGDGRRRAEHPGGGWNPCHHSDRRQSLNIDGVLPRTLAVLSPVTEQQMGSASFCIQLDGAPKVRSVPALWFYKPCYVQRLRQRPTDSGFGPAPFTAPCVGSKYWLSLVKILRRV